MNERQENVYQQYPTYENFLAAQGPNQILINFSNIHEIEESISVPRLSIAEMNEIYLRNDFNPGIDYYVKWLNFFNKFSNINKAMPMDIVNWAAIQLYLRYCHFYFADLKVIFEKILEAKYGKFFGSVDTVLIMSAFLQYNEERERLLHKEKERKDIEYESWRKVRSEQLRTEVYNELSSKHPDWLTGQIYEHMNQVVVQRIALEAKERFK